MSPVTLGIYVFGLCSRISRIYQCVLGKEAGAIDHVMIDIFCFVFGNLIFDYPSTIFGRVADYLFFAL